MLNNVTLMGRLTADVELRSIERKKQDDLTVGSFTIAVERDYSNKDGERDTDFIRCKAFGKTADFIDDYFKKGSMICVSGRIQTGKYENKDGDTVYTTDVVVDSAYFTGEKAKNNYEEGGERGYKKGSKSKGSKGKEKSNRRRYDDDEDG